MRWLWLTVWLGCGRVAFDSTTSLDAARVCTAPVGHDEDRDGVDDACDGCPHLADPGQADRDGDGVDDLCDPQPDVAAEHIEFFDAFVGAARPEWTFNVGTDATVTADEVRIESRTVSGYMKRPGAPVLDVIVIGGRVGAAVPTSSRKITTGARENGNPNYQCALGWSSTTSDLTFSYTDDGTNYFTTATLPLTGILENAPFTLTMRHGPQMACETTWPPGGEASAPLPPARNAVGVAHYFQGLEVFIEYEVQIRTE